MKSLIIFLIILAMPVYYGIRRYLKIVRCYKILADREGICVQDIKKDYNNHIEKLQLECSKAKFNVYIILRPSIKNSKKVSANSGIPKVILIDTNWIEKLFENQMWRIALAQTIGHELAHKDHEPMMTLIPSKKGRFTNWVRECRADFYGMQFVGRVYPEKHKAELLEIVKMKIDNNEPREEGYRKAKHSHPSWHLRYRLLLKYSNFGEDAIKEIAREADFYDVEYIRKVIYKAKFEA